MEGLIIFIVISVISFVLNKAKGGDEETQQKRKQMPPMSNNTPQNRRVEQSKPRTLEDFAKKITSEIEKKFEEPTNQRKIEEVKTKSQTKIQEYYANKQGAESTQGQSAGRANSSILERSKQLQEKRNQTLHSQKSARSAIVPNTQKGIAQAIIMSEILSPPVSKRK